MITKKQLRSFTLKYHLKQSGEAITPFPFCEPRPEFVSFVCVQLGKCDFQDFSQVSALIESAIEKCLDANEPFAEVPK